MSGLSKQYDHKRNDFKSPNVSVPRSCCSVYRSFDIFVFLSRGVSQACLGIPVSGCVFLSRFPYCPLSLLLESCCLYSVAKPHCLHYTFLLHSPFTSHLLPLAKSEIYLFHAHLLWVNSTYNKTGPGENLRRRFLHFPFMTF